jgi:hypothetical protein
MSNNAANSRYEDRALSGGTLAERGAAVAAEINKHRADAEQLISDAVKAANMTFLHATGLTLRDVNVYMTKNSKFSSDQPTFSVGAVSVTAAEFGGAR